MLACTHFANEEIENVIFIPKIGDVRTCPVCEKEKEILRVSQPYEKKDISIKDVNSAHYRFVKK